MIQEERLKQILAMIDKNGLVTVEDLTQKLYVSTSTVRRDLAELSARGLVRRTSGGAVALSDKSVSDPLAPEMRLDNGSAARIAARAAELVPEESCIFLSSSPAMLPLARALWNKKLTVVTNSVAVAEALCGHARVYCCGGLYQERDNCFTGVDATHFLSYFNYDIMFFSCTALAPDGMLEYSTPQELSVYETVMRRAGKKILLCSASKIGNTAQYNLLSADRVDILVTDAEALPKSLRCQVLTV
ncbi:DeoR/GlpR family DNA-binding transcription regulator [bacterium]|nr:DeoR/GlpR family DNA-binding transcription regulator [Gemmiger sp.]MCI7743597.1 DeoR/GlpR family DNA-binding transcription regulator [bacterium]MDY5782561.1 DeoR/GlpR family DNA-binding transcription regulator [Gemmiger sp.]